MTWDDLPSKYHLTKRNLNLKLQNLLSTENNFGRNESPKVKELLYTNHHLNNTALLLSNKSPFISKACYFSDNQNMAVHIPSFSGSVTRQLFNAINYINIKYNNYWWIITGAPQRTERYDYPKKAIKSAVLASFIYRDYHYKEMFNSFYAYKNKLIISIPMGRTIGKNINPNLTSVLTLLGFMTKSADLLQNIINAYRGTNKKPTIDKRLNRIILPNLNYGRV